MIRALERFVPYLLFVPAIVPLVFFDGLLYPYLTPKTLIVRADALLVLACFVVLVLSGHAFHWHRLREWATWIPGALLVVTYISSAFGAHFYHSFWSVFDRGDGLLTLSCLVVLFYFTLIYADRAFFERLLRIVAWVAGAVALYGLLQWFQSSSGLDIPLITTPSGRLSSTLGNAAYLASYLGLTLFVTFLALRNASFKMQKWYYWSAGLQALAIFGTATRGTMLALLAVLGVVALYLAWKGEGKYRAFARYALVGAALLLVLFFVFRAQLTRVPFEPLQRLASISLSEATVESRLFIWSTVPQEVGTHALLGVGGELIEPLFNRVYDPTKILEEWFDRTHNSYLDYFVQYGLVGLALYLALIIVFAREAWRRARDPKEAWNGQILLLLLVTYVIQNVFVFDHIATLWLLLLLYAFLIVREGKPTTLSLPRVPPLFAYAIGVVIALLIIPVSFTPLRANLLLAEGYRYHIFDVDRANERIERGFDLGTYASLEYGYQLYEMYVSRQMTMLQAGDRLAAHALVSRILAENYDAYPYDARTALYFAHILDVAPEGAPKDEARLRAVVARAIELSPRRMQSWYILANIPIRAGDAEPAGSAEKARLYQEGIDTLAEYAELVPSYAEPRFVIATLYLTLNDRARAKEWADQALPVYTHFDENTARRAARYYVSIEDWPNAVRFLAQLVTLKGVVNYPTMYDLAKVQWLMGDREEARELVERIRAESPGLFETDPNFAAEYGATEETRIE